MYWFLLGFRRKMIFEFIDCVWEIVHHGTYAGQDSEGKWSSAKDYWNSSRCYRDSTYCVLIFISSHNILQSVTICCQCSTKLKLTFWSAGWVSNFLTWSLFTTKKSLTDTPTTIVFLGKKADYKKKKKHMDARLLDRLYLSFSIQKIISK